MQLTLDQVDFIKKNNWMIFATCLKDKPRAAVMVPVRIEGGRIILSDNKMRASDKNTAANPHVFLSSYSGIMKRWIKITGTAEYMTEGSLYEEVAGFEKNKGFKSKAAIVVTFETIEEGNEG